MKSYLRHSLLVGLITLGTGCTATEATLSGRLESPCSGIYQAYYDDQLGVTWLADANLAKTSGFSDPYSADGSLPWDVANTWAAGLSINGVTGWRLPKVDPVDSIGLNEKYSTKGTTDNGFNISARRSAYEGSTANEIAHLFYNTLGNKAIRSLSGPPPSDWGLSNSGPFTNINPDYYWTKTESGVDPTKAGAFSFSGEQSWGSKGFYFKAWAVHDGDVAELEAQTQERLKKSNCENPQ